MSCFIIREYLPDGTVSDNGYYEEAEMLEDLSVLICHCNPHDDHLSKVGSMTTLHPRQNGSPVPTFGHLPTPFSAGQESGLLAVHPSADGSQGWRSISHIDVNTSESLISISRLTA